MLQNTSKVFYCDLYGTRDYKEKNYLIENDIDTVKWEELNVEEFNREFRKTKWGRTRFIDDLNLFVPLRNSNMEYGEFWGITEVFNEYNSGIQTKRDKLTIKLHKDELNEVLKDFQNLSEDKIKLKHNLPPDGRDWSVESARESLIKSSFDEKYIQKIHYRPFDVRRTYYLEKSKGFIGYPRFETMKHFLKGKNWGVVFKRSRYLKSTEFHHFFIIENLVDINFLDDQTYVAPLYLYQDNPKNKSLFDDSHGLNRIPNFTPEFQKFIRTKYSFQPTPEEILGYIYAVFYSPSYRDRYLEFLKIDFPRVPFVDNENTFKELSELGTELIEHHLMKKSYLSNLVTFPVAGNDEVENVKFEKGKVYINKTQYFDNIPSEVWEFYVGGYQVLDKWLKSRKDRTLSYEEKETFTKIVNILGFTKKQMGRIDEVVKEMN